MSFEKSKKEIDKEVEELMQEMRKAGAGKRRVRQFVMSTPILRGFPFVGAADGWLALHTTVNGKYVLLKLKCVDKPNRGLTRKGLPCKEATVESVFFVDVKPATDEEMQKLMPILRKLVKERLRRSICYQVLEDPETVRIRNTCFERLEKEIKATS